MFTLIIRSHKTSHKQIVYLKVTHVVNQQ